MSKIRSAFVPGLPQLLPPEKSEPWKKLNQAMTTLGQEVQNWGPDRIVLYSTQWMSVLGTSYQAQSRPKGVHVDENWHEWGDLAFDFPVDANLSMALVKETEALGYPARTVDYEGFPIDTGTIVALKFLNPLGKIPVSLVSSWVYADAKSSHALGGAARRVIDRSGLKTLVVASSLLTTRYFTDEISPSEDRVSSPSDDQWNQKILGLVETGSLSEIAALAPQFTIEAAVDMQFNGFHWLNGFWGNTQVEGRVVAYGPLWGTGAAVLEIKAKGDTK